MNCDAFKREIYHFQAGELTAEQWSACRDHADRCPPCAELLEVEEALLRGLKRRLRPASPPPGLETRVRVELRRAASSRRPGIGWLRQPWFAALAASLLLALLVIPANDFGTPVSTRVSRVVTVVDFDCDSAGLPVDRQRLCTHPRHLNALKLDGGGHWHVSLDDAAGRNLSTDRSLRGSRLRVEGLLYERIRTLHVERAD